MTSTISFMSANYVARQLDYHMTGGWGEGDQATSDYFQPIETFAERLDLILRDIRAMGFTAMDLWTAHLGPTWATDEHLAIARDKLAQYGLPVVSLAGWFGSTPEEFAATCRVAAALGAPVLGGSTSMLQQDRDFVVATLKEHGLKLGLENHPEKTPTELREKIGDGGDGTLGACVDTGWFGTQGYNAAQALEELHDVLFHVHLKDVLAEGAHDTCRYGQGIVPIRECVGTLQRIGYAEAISVEHEPEQFDPTADVAASVALLRLWMAREA